MLKILKSSVRDTIIYSIGTFSSKLAGLILVRLYTNEHFLSSNDFGVLNLAEANLQMMISILGLGLSYAFERWYWDEAYIEKRNSIFFTVMFATVVLALTIVVLSFPFSGFLSGVLFESADYAVIFQLMIINGAFEIIAQTPNSLIRLKERPYLFTMANIIKLIITVTAIAFFLIKLNLGLRAVYYGQLIGLTAYFAIISVFIFRHMSFRFEWQALAGMIRFRFPFLLPVIALNFFNYNDRILLSKLSGMVDAGIYSLGSKLSNTIRTFLLTAIWLALTPTIYKMMNDPDNKRFYSKVMTYLSFTILIVVMIFSFFRKEIVYIFAKEPLYYQAHTVVPFIAIGIFFGMLKDISLIGLNISKKTGSIATTTILVTLINLGLNFLLIPVIGMLGAATATMLSQILFFAIIYWIAQKHYSIPYEIGKIFMMLAIAAGLFGISGLLDALTLWLRVPLKLLLILLFPFLLYIFGFYEPVEIERLKGFWIKWRDPGRWMDNLRSLNF